MKFLEEEKNVSLPSRNQLYDALRHLVRLQKVQNLKVADVVQGHLGPNVTLTPALAGEPKFYLIGVKKLGGFGFSHPR